MLKTFVNAGAGFLLGILCMDLLFDLQVLRDANTASAVQTISQYYRHCTLAAYPFNRLIALVMLLVVFGTVSELWKARTWPNLIALCLCLPPVLMAGRIVPQAQQLGAGKDDSDTQLH